MLSTLLATLPEALTQQLQSGRELTRGGESEDLLPTAVAALDRLFDGGLVRGEVVELRGSRTSGRFSLILTALAAATQRGEGAALVDLGDHLDPQGAAAFGVELERLLWLRPRHLKQAFAAAETVLGAGFPLVVLDLGTPPVPGGRGGEAAWLRLARAAKARAAVLLVSTPYRASGTAATAVLELRAQACLWQGRHPSPRLLVGLRARARVEKRRGRRPGAVEPVELHLESGAFPLPTYASLPAASIETPGDESEVMADAG